MINLDSLSYAGNLDNLAGLCATSHLFIQGSINDGGLVSSLLSEHEPFAVVNFAAETHVDRSIDSPSAFIQTNVNGAFELLQASLAYWKGLNPEARAKFRFVHVSTDEVYGSIAEGGFTEKTPYAPNSPYAASKAAADHLVRAFNRTYGLPTLITNCGNNYGPRQFPEKLVPHMILSALAGEKLPIYGDGMNVRDWLHVDDHCDALMRVIEGGRSGETYNVGGYGERSNIQVVQTLCDTLQSLRPRPEGYRGLMAFVTDRPGHDRRYSLDSSKICRELGWKPMVQFDAGLASTVAWYLDNADWCARVKSGGYRVARIGLGQDA